MSAVLCFKLVDCAVGEGVRPILSQDAPEGRKISEQHSGCFALRCEVLQRGRQRLHVPLNHVTGVGEHECGEPRDTLQDSHVSC